MTDEQKLTPEQEETRERIQAAVAGTIKGMKTKGLGEESEVVDDIVTTYETIQENKLLDLLFPDRREAIGLRQLRVDLSCKIVEIARLGNKTGPKRSKPKESTGPKKSKPKKSTGPKK